MNRKMDQFCGDLLLPLQSISVYECRAILLVVGLCSESKRFVILEIKRTVGQLQSNPEMSLHPISYTSKEVDQLTTQLKCIRIISDAYSIYGFIRLVESFYMIVVTKATCIATLYGHNLYTISDTNVVPITYKVRNTMEETKYKSILQNLNLSNSEFYFSYTLDLTSSLQKNMLSNSMPSFKDDQKNMYIWNYFALNPFINHINSHQVQDHNEINQQPIKELNIPLEHHIKSKNVSIDQWIVPIVYGFLKQKTIRLMTGYTFKYTLIARRSRLFAGTRYLRRGVDIHGFTANEVETEQIVTKELNSLNNLRRSSSLTQIRGSIPLYWYHVNHFVPSPDIRIDSNRGHTAALSHFNRLINNYGDNIMVINLVRACRSTREVTVGKAFEELIIYLNEHYRATSGLEKNDQSKGKNNNNNENDGYSNINSNDNDDKRITTKIQHKSKVKEKELPASSKNITKIGYISFDFHGSAHSSLFSKLGTVCDQIFPKSGFYTEPPPIINSCYIQKKCSKQKKSDSMIKESLSSQYVLWPLDKITSEIDIDGSLTGLVNNSYQSKLSDCPKQPQPSKPKRGSSPLLDDLISPCVSTSSTSAIAKSSIFASKSQDEQIKTEVENDFDDGNFSRSNEALEIEMNKSNEGGLGSGVYHGLLQHGVLRTNCVDCLDRTNVAQFCYAQCALPYQFKSLGVELSVIDMQRFADICTEVWAQHGDALARQYGGSGAMHSISAPVCRPPTTSSSHTTTSNILDPLRNLLNPSRSLENSSGTLLNPSRTLLNPSGSSESSNRDTADSDDIGVNNMNDDYDSSDSIDNKIHSRQKSKNDSKAFALSGGAKNAFVAVQRYYSNVSTDFERQQCIDLLLGIFQPSRGGVPIWDTDMNIPTLERGKNEKEMSENSRGLNSNGKDFDDDHSSNNVNEKNGGGVQKDSDDTNTGEEDTSDVYNIDPDSKDNIYDDSKQQAHNGEDKEFDRKNLMNDTIDEGKVHYFPHRCLNFVNDGFQEINLSETDSSSDLIALDMATYTRYPAQSNGTSNVTHPNNSYNITSKNNVNRIKTEVPIDDSVQFKSPSKIFSDFLNAGVFDLQNPRTSAASSSSTSLPHRVSTSEKLYDNSDKKTDLIPNRGSHDDKVSDRRNQIEIIDLKDNIKDSHIELLETSPSPTINNNLITSENSKNVDNKTTRGTIDRINHFFAVLFPPLYPSPSDPNIVHKIDSDLSNYEEGLESNSSHESTLNTKDDCDSVDLQGKNDKEVLVECDRGDYNEKVKVVETCPIQ